MGASGWSYVTPYRGDVSAALRELRERVFRDREYYWWDDFEEDGPHPGSIDELLSHGSVAESGTHSILDVNKVVATTDLPDWHRTEDYGTVRPLAPDRILHHFGTDRPSRSRFETLSKDQQAPGFIDFIDEVKMRGTGLYVLLYDGDTPTEVGFWGFSGD
jgi:hypothetical protein